MSNRTLNLPLTPTVVGFLWLAVCTLIGWDAAGGGLSWLSVVAFILAAVACTLTVIGWLERHLVPVVQAYRLGVADGYERGAALRLLREP